MGPTCKLGRLLGSTRRGSRLQPLTCISHTRRRRRHGPGGEAASEGRQRRSGARRLGRGSAARSSRRRMKTEESWDPGWGPRHPDGRGGWRRGARRGPSRVTSPSPHLILDRPHRSRGSRRLLLPHLHHLFNAYP